MKIRLNENEIYEIKLPDEIKSSELPMITARFNILSKTLSKFTPLSDKENKDVKSLLLGETEKHIYKKQNKEQWKLLRDNRKIVLELLNAYYNGTMKEFDDLKSKYNITFDRNTMASMGMIRIKELHKIKPKEIGLIKFPTRKEDVEMCRIK